VSNWYEINYLQPFYSANGANHTRIGLAGKPPHEEPRRTKTVLDSLAAEFSCDLNTLKGKTAAVIGRSNNLPLVLHPQMALLPVRMRQAQAKKDGATGFIVLNKIKNILPGPPAGQEATSIIEFYDGSTLQVLQQAESLYRLQGEALQMLREISPLYPGIGILPGMPPAGTPASGNPAAALNAGAAGGTAPAASHAAAALPAGTAASRSAAAMAPGLHGKSSSNEGNPRCRAHISISITQEVNLADAGELAKLLEIAQNGEKLIMRLLKTDKEK